MSLGAFISRTKKKIYHILHTKDENTTIGISKMKQDLKPVVKNETRIEEKNISNKQKLETKKILDGEEQRNNTIIEIEKYEKEKEIRNKEIEETKLLFQNEIIKPDDYQINAILESKKNESLMILASAGSGKTTLFPMLIYEKKNSEKIKNEEIVCLSMTNIAKNTINNKLNEYGIENISCKTLHSYFADCYEKIKGIRPKFSNPDTLNYFIEEELQTKDWFSFYNGYIKAISFEEDMYMDWNEREKRLKSGQIISLKGETLKSYGELYISSWLALHGIDYEYEREYPYSFFGYKPDFYIPTFDLWIEYFGIDENGNVAHGFTSRKGTDVSTIYKLEMQEKQKEHNKNGTKLLSLYLYQRKNGELDKILEEQLGKYAKQIDNPIEIWETNTNYNIGIKRISNLLEHSMLFMEARDLTPKKVKDDASYKNPYLFEERVALSTICSELLERRYKKEQEKGNISFSQLANIVYDLILKEKDFVYPKYLLIDEFQDIPYTFLKIIKLFARNGTKIVFAGDIKQSVYHFAGCISFEELLDNFPNIKIIELPLGKRVPQDITLIMNDFINKDKCIPKSNNHSLCNNKGKINILSAFTNMEMSNLVITKIVEEHLLGHTILLQGRTNDTVYWFVKYCDCKVKKIIGSSLLQVIFPNNITCYYGTFHSSKGSEFDTTFILEFDDKNNTFPGFERISVLESLYAPKTTISNAIDRKLFYTATTRTKNNVYIISLIETRDKFVKELLQNYNVQEILE